MTLPQSLILVCAGADTARAALVGRPLLDLCLGLSAQGALTRVKLSPQTAPFYLGIRDAGAAAASCNPNAIADALIYECDRLNASGVFADFETGSSAVHKLCMALDERLHEQGIPFFVPSARADDVKHAVLTFATAISGGSLLGMFEEAQNTYGSARVAGLLQPVCADFCLPSGASEGTPLNDAERKALLSQKSTQVFFSRDLCAKYFTYMDEENQGHFVMFDDDSTLENKLTALTNIGVQYLFALYPDLRGLL